MTQRSIWLLVAFLMIVIIGGFVVEQSRIDALEHGLAAAQSENVQLVADMQVTKNEASFNKVRVSTLTAQVATIEAQAKANRVEWHSETQAFESGFDHSQQSYLLITPVVLGNVPHPLVVYFHSMGNRADEVTKWQAGDETLVSFLIRREAIIASPEYRGDSWLNSAAAADVVQLIRTLQSRFAISTIILSGYSMGASAALMYPLLASDTAIGGIVAAVFASDVADLWAETKNAQVKESLRVAYGGAPSDQPRIYGDRSVLRNIVRLPSTLPLALYASYSDSTIPTSQQTRLRDALAARGNPMLYVSLPGDHDVNDFGEGFAFVLNRAGKR